jgi:hypothetical protein
MNRRSKSSTNPSVAVVIRKRLLTDDRREAPQFAAAAEEGGDLVGDAAMILAHFPRRSRHS